MRKRDPDRRRATAVSGLATVSIVAGTGACGLVGYVQGGVMAGLLGALAGMALTVGGYVVTRAWTLHRRTLREQRQAPLPSDPKQALVVLATRMTVTDPSRNLTSDVLRSVEDLREQAQRDRDAARIELDRLATEHPRNPVVIATRSEFAFADGDAEAGRRDLAHAIELAVAGGMGQWAALRLEAHREIAEQLELHPSTRNTLAKIQARRARTAATLTQ